jgi:hypothetical protein
MQRSMARKATLWPSFSLPSQASLAANRFLITSISARLAAAGGAAEEVIQVQCLDGIVRADAVSGGHFAKPRGVLGLRLRCSRDGW